MEVTCTRENNKPKEIKPDTKPGQETFSSRKNKTVINRLKACHRSMTHRYLIGRQPVPQCELCQNDTMTMKHILTSCPELI